MGSLKRVFIPDCGGFGNQVECVGVYLDLVKVFSKLDVFLGEPKISKPFWNLVARKNRAKVFDADSGIDTSCYDVAFCVRDINWVKSKEVIKVKRTLIQSEVKDNEQLLHKLDIRPTPVSLPWKEYRKRSWKSSLVKKPKQYDVVIANGGQNRRVWLKKRYQRWNEVIEELQEHGHSVACIGLKDEYVYPAIDCTHLSFLEQLDLISNCRVFACNDTGFYHFACAVNVPTVVVFTATNIEKNFDRNFHRYATVIKPEIDCFPCQGLRDNLWRITERFHKCEWWECCMFPPRIILDQIKKKLHPDKFRTVTIDELVEIENKGIKKIYPGVDEGKEDYSIGGWI